MGQIKRRINMKIDRKVAELEVNMYDAIFWYLKLTQPLNNLIKSEIKLVSIILYMYHVSDEKDIEKRWKNVFSYDNRIKMMEYMDINSSSLNNHLTRLRQKDILINNKIIPNLNPFISKDSEMFEVILRFKIKKNGKDS